MSIRAIGALLGREGFTKRNPREEENQKLPRQNVLLYLRRQTHLQCGHHRTPVLTNFDIIATAGAALTAIDKTFPITVTNGQVTIQFTSGSADLPKVSAIQVHWRLLKLGSLQFPKR